MQALFIFNCDYNCNYDVFAGAQRKQHAVNTESNGDETVASDLQQDKQVHRCVSGDRRCVRRCFVPGS